MACVTGQHREMLDQVLRLFEIVPQYDLNIMKHGQDLYDVTARVLVGLRDVLKETQPDWVLVQMLTTYGCGAGRLLPAGAVAHVEGVMYHDPYSPWPEEMNRQITSRIATCHFSPTLSRQNLLNEVDEAAIAVTATP